MALIPPFGLSGHGLPAWLPSCLLACLARQPDQTRPDQAKPDMCRPDQTSPDQTRTDQTRPPWSGLAFQGWPLGQGG